jgi:hypothetical protein
VLLLSFQLILTIQIMSGLEVISGISAVIAKIDSSVKVWKSARKDLKLSETFETVANRLPILRDTLQTCHEHFEPIQTTLPTDAAQSLLKTVHSCETKVEKLHTIFEETIAGENDQWYDRYRKVARRLGMGSKVEELMKSVTEDAQGLVNYHTVKSARPDLCMKLRDIITEMKSVEPSLPSDDIVSQTFNAYGGLQNVSTGNSTQYNSSILVVGRRTTTAGFRATLCSTLVRSDEAYRPTFEEAVGSCVKILIIMYIPIFNRSVLPSCAISPKCFH